MPSVSKKQKRFFGLIRAVQTGAKPEDEVSSRLRKVAHSISAKDASDFASSLVELKTKKKVLSILKENTFINEDETVKMDPIAKIFHVKEEWTKYIKPYIGQPLSSKELEALGNFKEKQPGTIKRTEIWYNTTDPFGS